MPVRSHANDARTGAATIDPSDLVLVAPDPLCAEAPPAALAGGAPAQPESYAWRRFELEWEATPGRHALRARATDASGTVQPDTAEPNRLGHGNNVIRTLTVEVH